MGRVWKRGTWKSGSNIGYRADLLLGLNDNAEQRDNEKAS
jgi:hypothetical protein